MPSRIPPSIAAEERGGGGSRRCRCDPWAWYLPRSSDYSSGSTRVLFWAVFAGMQVAGSRRGGGLKGVAPSDVIIGYVYVEGGKRPESYLEGWGDDDDEGNEFQERRNRRRLPWRLFKSAYSICTLVFAEWKMLKYIFCITRSRYCRRSRHRSLEPWEFELLQGQPQRRWPIVRLCMHRHQILHCRLTSVSNCSSILLRLIHKRHILLLPKIGPNPNPMFWSHANSGKQTPTDILKGSR